MVTKIIRSSVLCVVVWGCLYAAAYAIQDQKIYPLPGTESEYVVAQWLQRFGYHLRRSTTDNYGVQLYAQKGSKSWQITLWPHSPLATRIKAKYKVKEKVDDSQLQYLWSMLGTHMETVVEPGPDKGYLNVPAAITSKTESVVCIYSGSPENLTQISGFIIDKKGLIICTAHGLKNIQQPLTVTLHDGRQLKGRVVKMDKRYDLSLVDVNTDLETSIRLSDSRDLLEEAEPLYNVVCHADSECAIFPGMLNGAPRIADNQMLWQVKMKIRPGSSGSPVFDLHGNLVAIVKGRYRTANGIGFLIPFSSLIKFLSDHPK